MPRLSKRQVDAEISKTSTEVRLWDDDPRGLGLRIKPSGVATFFIQYTSPLTFKKTRLSIGQYGKLTIDKARGEAKRLFEQIANGRCPSREKAEAKDAALSALTLAEFCDDYLADCQSGIVTYRGRAKKPSTISVDRGRIIRHIKPLVGHKRVDEVTRADAERMMHDIRLGKTATDEKTGFRGRARVTGGQGTATKATKLLGSIMSYAIKRGLRSDNPVTGIEYPPDGKRQRIFNPDEFRRLGDTLLEEAEKGAPEVAIRAYKLLALTGCRREEIFALTKSQVDLHRQCFVFGDTKTGQQLRPFGNAAAEILALPEIDKKSQFVFPSPKTNGHWTSSKRFVEICKKARVEEVSIHVLRHSYLSVALELEYSELTIAVLGGHKTHSITSRYAHHVDRALVEAADRVSKLIAARMSGAKETEEKIIKFSRKRRDG